MSTWRRATGRSASKHCKRGPTNAGILRASGAQDDRLARSFVTLCYHHPPSAVILSQRAARARAKDLLRRGRDDPAARRPPPPVEQAAGHPNVLLPPHALGEPALRERATSFRAAGVN